MKPIPPADLWAPLNSFMAKVAVKTRPEGYFTAPEFAERYDITVGMARDRLALLYSEGKVDRMWITTGVGGRCLAYRVKR